MSAVELIALASSVSLLAGWRLYLVTFVTGLGDEVRLDRPARPARRARRARQQLGDRHRRASARSPNSSPTRSPGSTARGTRSTRSSGRSAARCSASRSSMPATPPGRSRSFLLGGGAAFARPCRQGRRADHRQRQPRAVLQHRRLDRRGRRDRRPARAGHRQPDRRRADRGDPGHPVAVAGARGAAGCCAAVIEPKRPPDGLSRANREDHRCRAISEQPARRAHRPGARRRRAQQQCRRQRPVGRRQGRPRLARASRRGAGGAPHDARARRGDGRGRRRRTPGTEWSRPRSSRRTQPRERPGPRTPATRGHPTLDARHLRPRLEPVLRRRLGAQRRAAGDPRQLRRRRRRGAVGGQRLSAAAVGAAAARRSARRPLSAAGGCWSSAPRCSPPPRWSARSRPASRCCSPRAALQGIGAALAAAQQPRLAQRRLPGREARPRGRHLGGGRAPPRRRSRR